MFSYDLNSELFILVFLKNHIESRWQSLILLELKNLKIRLLIYSTFAKNIMSSHLFSPLLASMEF